MTSEIDRTTDTAGIRGPAKRSRLRGWIFRLIAVGVGCLIATAIVEIGLRLARDPNRFYPYYPDSVSVSYPNQQITPGVSGDSYFRANSEGCRGPEYDGQRHGLLTVGGSTTACTQLDDSEAWPQLVMDDVNSQLGDSKALWVTNSGIDGLNTRHHIMHAQYLLPRLKNVQNVILYCGINDAGSWLFTEKYDPDFLDKQQNWDNTVAQCFRWSCYTPADYPWYKRFEIYKRAALLKNAYVSRRHSKAGHIVEDDRLQWLEQAQKERRDREQSFVPRAKMETIRIALEAYARNLERFIELSRKAGVEPIFMSQAIEYTGLTEEQKKKLWVGALNGGKAYLDEKPMQELVDRYNARMVEVAAAKNVPFIDLPAQLNGESPFTYDGCHFNESGSRNVAKVVSDFLVQHVYRESAPVSTNSNAVPSDQGAKN